MTEKTLLSLIYGLSHNPITKEGLDRLMSHIEGADNTFDYKKNRLEKIRTSLLSKSLSTVEMEECYFELANWFFFVYHKNQKPEWFVHKLSVFYEQNPQLIRFCTYYDMFQEGWIVKDVILSAILLSEESIDGYISNDEELEHWVRLREKNLPYYVGILFCGELIGQFGGIAINEVEYSQLKQGSLNEDAILGCLEEKEAFALYISSIAIKKEFRSYKNLLKLMSASAKILSLAMRDLEIEYVIAIAYTDEGIRLCKISGLNFVGKHQNKGMIFEAPSKFRKFN